MSMQGCGDTTKEAALRKNNQDVHMLQGDTQVPANRGAIKMEALTKTRQWATGNCSRLAVYMVPSHVAGLQRKLRLCWEQMESLS